MFMLFFVPGFSAKGQIAISQADMPSDGDTIRHSVTINLSGIDFESTGENIIWDFSTLDFQLQQVDSFVNTTTTPFFYQIVFNPLVSNLARKGGDFSLIPGFAVTDIYQYFKNDASYFKEVGIAITLEGIPFPMKYTSDDIIYNFPLNYGDKDSSTAIFEFTFPGLGFIGIEKNRRNVVDGWGEVITPLGQFDVLRVYSEIREYDTAYIDSLGTGFGLTRNYEEFKWLASGMGTPVVSVIREGLVVTATYQDIYRPPSSLREAYNLVTEIKVFPVPANDFLHLSFRATGNDRVTFDLISMEGSNVFRLGTRDIRTGNNFETLKLNGSIPAGFYVLKLSGRKISGSGKVLVF